MRTSPSKRGQPLAIKPMASCEKIDGVTYQLNTFNAVKSLMDAAAPNWRR
ncbi:MAG: hypothetical protein IPH37_14660 [Burkholderiales bacterium]|nr:hypothetical protein [Burkholderiales bacterium]